MPCGRTHARRKLWTSVSLGRRLDSSEDPQHRAAKSRVRAPPVPRSSCDALTWARAPREESSIGHLTLVHSRARIKQVRHKARVRAAHWTPIPQVLISTSVLAARGTSGPDECDADLALSACPAATCAGGHYRDLENLTLRSVRCTAGRRQPAPGAPGRERKDVPQNEEVCSARRDERRWMTWRTSFWGFLCGSSSVLGHRRRCSRLVPGQREHTAQARRRWLPEKHTRDYRGAVLLLRYSH